MSAARTEILARIRQSLGRTAAGEMEKDLERRLQQPPTHPRPVIPAEQDLVGRLIDKLDAVQATVDRVAGYDQAPAAVMRFLQQHILPLEVVMSPDPSLSQLPWPEQLGIAHRAAERQDVSSVTGCFAAVAETGTLVLLSGPEHPTSLNFLPDNHVVVLPVADILRYPEDVWGRLRAQAGGMPRTVNFVTGPSRTADVEQTLQLGAHGPRRLHVLLVEEQRTLS